MEGFLKSLLLGLAIGFGANSVAALVAWFTISENLALALGITLGVLVFTTAVSTTVFYITKFRPTEKSSARKIDRLGLEERLITMVEFRDSDDVIARLQREDAKRELEKVEKKQLRMKLPRAIVILSTVAAVIGCGLTTLSGLSAAGYILSGSETIDAIIPDEPPVYVSVTYIVEEGGFIEGEEDQIIVVGESTNPIVAVAEDGWEFVGWDDGGKFPERFEVNVETDLTLTAIFMPIMGGDFGFPGEDGEPSDMPGEMPSDQPGDTQDPNGDPSAIQGGGEYSANNQVIDGDTSYNVIIGEYYDAAMEALANGKSDSSSEAEEAAKNYYDIIN